MRTMLLLILLCPLVCYGLTDDQSYYLPAFAKEKVKYVKDLPIGKPWGMTLKNVVINIESPDGRKEKLWSHDILRPEKIIELLSRYIVVSEHEWCHGFSHVAQADLCGIIKFPKGDTFDFFLRPGGLAAVIYSNGGIVYLTRCRSEVAK